MVCSLDHISNEGERILFSKLDEYLDSTYIVYHNREISGLEFDYCVLIPNVGLCIIEVKGWHENTVQEVQANSQIKIRTETGSELCNPRTQARAYRFATLNYLQSRLGKNLLVFQMLCYPFLTDDFYQSKQMDINCSADLAFTMDDLETRDAFIHKFDSATSLFSEWNVYPFNPDTCQQVRSLFEPGYSPNKTPKSQPHEPIPAESSTVIQSPIEHHYSLVFSLRRSNPDWEQIIEEVSALYASGCKIVAFFDDEELHRYALKKLDEILERRFLTVGKKGELSLGLHKALDISSPTRIFNWTSYAIPTEHVLFNGHEMHIIDGLVTQDDMERLQVLNDQGLFNLGQFQVEHTGYNSNILVKAGAGTGKTTVMISRIAYLCHMNSFTAKDLQNHVTMITFTNDAARNMSHRLKAYFINAYLLTGFATFLEMSSSIDHMKISTIHMLAKKLISSEGTLLGYGQDVAITSSTFQRKKMITNLVEKIVRIKGVSDKGYIDRLGQPIYAVKDCILDFIQRLENKSIEVGGMSIENFGCCSEHPELHELIVTAAIETENELSRLLRKNNQIHLNSMMQEFMNLVSRFPERIQTDQMNRPSYLFIDEFQDTDDIQIEVLQRYARIRNCRLFVVGDVKQCIYRFRGAEVKAFDQLDPDVNGLPWSSHVLTMNYRTDSELLGEFQNMFEKWGNTTEEYLTYKREEDALINPLTSNGNLPRELYFRSDRISDNTVRPEKLYEVVIHKR
jgi:hypothetical protein